MKNHMKYFYMKNHMKISMRYYNKDKTDWLQ